MRFPTAILDRILSSIVSRKKPSSINSLSLPPTSKNWPLAFVPLLAIFAYLPVLTIGFLGDDLVLLSQGADRKWDIQLLLPDPDWFFYRPVGLILTWQLGSHIWGANPFPYHLMSLLLHASVSLALGVWVTEATRKPILALLTGSLFATFPLHVEVAGWVAAQWDAWATLFGLLSLWLFTRWWRIDSAWPLYFLSVLLYGLSLFTIPLVIDG